MKKEIRVFIVDDSAVVRYQITKIISKGDKRIKVIGSAPNGKIALIKLALPKYKADIILVDALMPDMDGFATIGHIMDRFPTPVIMVTGLTKREVDKSLSHIGMSAFESGAVEFVKKPDSNFPNDNKRFEKELFFKIQNLSQIDLERAYSAFDFKTFLTEEIEEPTIPFKPEIVPKKISNLLIVIGSSTGGPRAISLVLSKIPPKSPPIIIVQHMPEVMVDPWVRRLKSLYPQLNIKIPTNGEKILPNKVYIAPGGKHCGIKAGKTFHLFIAERINFVIPAIDVTFSSAAKVYHQNILGIILTGMGKDGFEGAKKIKAVGGKIFVEHESTSVIYSMPKAIIDGNLADEIIPLHNIPSVMHKRGWF